MTFQVPESRRRAPRGTTRCCRGWRPSCWCRAGMPCVWYARRCIIVTRYIWYLCSCSCLLASSRYRLGEETIVLVSAVHNTMTSPPRTTTRTAASRRSFQTELPPAPSHRRQRRQPSFGSSIEASKPSFDFSGFFRSSPLPFVRTHIKPLTILILSSVLSLAVATCAAFG